MPTINDKCTMTIDGKPATAPTTIDVINPTTEEVIARAPDASRALLDDAVSAARRAFPKWRATPLEQRRVAVAKIADSSR
jgi:acyl-CoA reductase-like NAD-dependent aldehyde dehydrogenase